MELHSFAEQVLFATTLEEKLRTPSDITDERPGPALTSPASPGRPKELQFKGQGSGGEFPGVHNLDKQEERGRLLHFFANHELLATELMALVLLKFPDAPTAFRRGVLQTLKDEQEHTRLYIARMKECGIHFGDMPVSGYFWRSVAPMENPMDYVSTLSLTFEQANLDFARHFSRVFGQVGDAQSAALLEKIYRDEIGHVAYGLKWFRRWKNPNESDWVAFCRQLKFPLSPQRAKGFSLNVEGRRAAGLDPAFIAELDVFSHSKGRTPTVFIFNPFAEGRMAQGKSFNLSRHQAGLQRDLSNLPQYLCRQDDIVLVHQRPSVEFLSEIKRVGFDLPEFVEIDERHGLKNSVVSARKLGRLRPWAWSPDSVELLQPLFSNLTAEKRSADESFNAGIGELYSKAWSAAFLRKVLPQLINEFPSLAEWLCSENEVGLAVRTVDEALAAIATIRNRVHHAIVLKQALGLAGGNALRLLEPDLLEAQRKWIATSLQNGRQLVVEKWLPRVQDFSVQLEMSADGLNLCGYTGLMVDRNGQFQGNWAGPKFERRIPATIASSLGASADVVQRIHLMYEHIFELLEVELHARKFIGPVSIDAFVYRTANGRNQLKPIVEINPRFTMGRVMLELMKHVAPGSYGLFRLMTAKMVAAEQYKDFAHYSEMLKSRCPVRTEGEPVRKIREGAVCLNDPTRATTMLAILNVSSSPDLVSQQNSAA